MSNITLPIENAFDEKALPGAGEPGLQPPFDAPMLPESDIGLPEGPTSLATTVLAIVYASLIITTNLVMLIAYAVEKRLQTYNNSFILNLILTDLAIGFSMIVLIARSCHPGVYWCKIFLGINDGLLSVSIISIVIICIDRHRATYHPIKHFTTRSNTRAWILNIVAWVVAYAFWLPMSFLGLDAITPTDEDRSVGIVLLSFLSPILMIFAPLLIIAVLYARILYKIRCSLGAKHVNVRFKGKTGGSGEDTGPNSKPNLGTGPTASSSNKTKSESGDGTKIEITDAPQTRLKEKRKPGNRESDASARKATRSLSFIIISFLVSWMPHVIFVVVTTIDQSILFESKVPDVVLAFVSTIRLTNSFLNPFSYAAAQPLFRRTVAAIICKPRQYC